MLNLHDAKLQVLEAKLDDDPLRGRYVAAYIALEALKELQALRVYAKELEALCDAATAPQDKSP